MHHDMKVGLALGVLLVGIVGALFFRRPADAELQDDARPDVAHLDEQLEHRRVRPYLSRPGSPPPVSSPAVTSRSPRSANRPVREDADAASDAFPFVSGTVTTPPGDPIRTGNRTRADQGTAVESPRPRETRTRPPGTTGWGPLDAPATPASTPAHSPATSLATPPRDGDGSVGPIEPQRTHIVKQGETLSAIAAKYLGSSARFHEIFDANKGTLNNPNDVSPGMTLVIPTARKGKAAGTERLAKPVVPEPVSSLDEKRDDATRESVGDETPVTAKGLFAPAPRKPLSTGSGPSAERSPRSRLVSQEKGTDAPTEGEMPANDRPESSASLSELPGVDDELPPVTVSTLRRERDGVGSRSTTEPSVKPLASRSTWEPLDTANSPSTPATDATADSSTEREPASPSPRKYRVVRGDTLERISLKFYGTRSKVRTLLEANRAQFAVAEQLREGMEIVIP